MSIPGVGSGGSVNTNAIPSHPVQTIQQKLAEANAEKSSGGLNDGDENTAAGTQINKYA